MNNKTLLLSLAASVLIGFTACKKEEKKIEDKKDDTPAALTVKNEQRGFIGYVGATWCPPCVAEMPSLQNLYDVYGDQVDFYFVTAEERDVVDAFMKKKGYTLPVYLQRFNPPAQLQERSIPTTFLIGKHGNIVIKKTGAADWDDESTKAIIRKLLDEK